MTVRQRLSPIIFPASLTINGIGVAAYPDGFIQVDAMYKVDGVTQILSVQQDKLSAYVNSAIDPIAENPIYLVTNTGFQFYPINLAAAKISYIKKPTQMVWASSVDGNGRQIYSSAGSTQPIWDDVAMQDIISRGLRLVGLNLQANDVAQYSNELKSVGQ